MAHDAMIIPTITRDAVVYFESANPRFFPCTSMTELTAASTGLADTPVMDGPSYSNAIEPESDATETTSGTFPAPKNDSTGRGGYSQQDATHPANASELACHLVLSTQTDRANRRAKYYPTCSCRCVASRNRHVGADTDVGTRAAVDCDVRNARVEAAPNDADNEATVDRAAIWCFYRVD